MISRLPVCVRRPAAVVAAVAVVAVLAQSGGTTDLRDPGPAQAQALATPTGSPSPPPPLPPSPSPSPSPTDDDAPPVLTLQGDGLGLLDADGVPAPLLFGAASPDDVRQQLETLVGDTAQVPLACPQGPRTGLRADGLTALFDGEAFVGWTDVGAPDRSTTTADGVGVGSSLADLQSAVPDLQVQSGPGGTTAASPGGLSAVLSGPDPAATVTQLSGGQTCAGG